jgi:methyl coenzyme M reductase subunit D
MFNNFFRKWCRLFDNVEKYGTAKQTIDENMIGLTRFAYRMSKAGTHIHTHNV